ncbi:MAG: methyltransferase domain-containing protein [archaeon]|nr:methyltransferase domain-containing protein [archaeon]
MQLAFELSGEHETLPKAEVLACLQALNVVYEERMFSDGILVIDAQLSSESELLDVLSQRLGMTHHIYEVKGMCVPDEKELVEIVNNADIEAVMDEEDTFAVRVRGEHKNSFSLKRNELPTIVGERIKRKGYKVNLKNPSKTFVLLLTAHTCFFCLLSHSVKKKQFEEKKPRFRPFFLPGVIMPKVARVMVNLSGLNAKELFLDPFCGTGGILIEAGMVGARIIGIDVQEKMVRGAKENLKFFGLPGDVVVGDASKLPLGDNTVDAVATDMPYGRSSFVSTSRYENAESHSLFLERLYQHALDEIHRVLKPGRKAVIVSNSPSFHYLYHKSDFQLLEKHIYRVHKSLNRYITVLEKEK